MGGNATIQGGHPLQAVLTKHVAAPAQKGGLVRDHDERETPRPKHLTAAEKALLAEDIVFDETESVARGDDWETSIYYVVTLVWRAQKTEA